VSKQNLHDDDPATTGHEWDGIQEFDNPLPRWWLWTFIASIIVAIAIMVLYPALPTFNGPTKGLLGYSSRADVAADIQRFKTANEAVDTKLSTVPLADINNDPVLRSYAMNGGAAVFKTWCAQCHGRGADGVKMGSGYPNLIDDDWLWGGTIEDIHTTITHGIRFSSDADTRDSQMPQFGDILEPGEIAQLVQHVRAISGQSHDAVAAKAGAVLFADNCAACHGDAGTGGREVGAPNLTDAIWLYGGDVASITNTVTNAHYGTMPAWGARLTESQIRQVATFVHESGGGE
jgi:cytochrome c oxidase cbb3-type subunit 3